ncbi:MULTISPECIES: ATP-binding protein [Pseudomonas]|uniref:ATP-binding protein n=1 Tax=Pseudomonas TaxID=286 RepID=UPI0018AC3CE1|nr:MULTISPECIES: ATP-binding protein [Pseudomonas]MBF8745807.1 ATP-binding protein [Pseudomonas monteilii]MCT8166057.1 ATP-binding protein [Pseudomonas sp. HD6422]MCT8184972.1 ATP-binding protein [Pseudomonas sp. HD6421]
MNIPASRTLVLPLEDASQVGHARRTAQQLAERQGFDSEDAGRVALLATELASNVLKHAGHGALHLRSVPGADGPGIEMLAVDRAEGFDADVCLTDGYSTLGTQGIGLGAVTRLAQVFDMYTDARGSVILARLYRRDIPCADLRIGVSHHALHDDPACGDTWHVTLADGRLSALLVDGLGHGPEAEQAALAAANAFAQHPMRDPLLLIEHLHQAMGGTRGGAVAIAQHDAHNDRLAYTGIGNIGATLVSGNCYRGLASLPGIVGGQYRKVQVFDYADVTGNLLILYSDGLQSRWNLQDYPGLVHRHPAVIATVLHRDFCRGRDDVTVLVIDLEPSHG